MQVSGYGEVRDMNQLDMTLVAAGAPSGGGGIPIVSSALGWVMRGVERELFQLEVTGPLSKPKFALKHLAKVMWPLTSLRTILTSPFYRSDKGASE